MNKSWLIAGAAAVAALWYLKKKGGLAGLGFDTSANPYTPRSPEWYQWATDQANYERLHPGTNVVVGGGGGGSDGGGFGTTQKPCPAGTMWKRKLHYIHPDSANASFWLQAGWDRPGWSNCWKAPKPKKPKVKRQKGILFAPFAS